MPISRINNKQSERHSGPPLVSPRTLDRPIFRSVPKLTCSPCRSCSRHGLDVQHDKSRRRDRRAGDTIVATILTALSLVIVCLRLYVRLSLIKATGLGMFFFQGLLVSHLLLVEARTDTMHRRLDYRGLLGKSVQRLVNTERETNPDSSALSGSQVSPLSVSTL